MSEKTDKLLEALRVYDYCKKAYDEAMHKCEPSWGYYGHTHIMALFKAEEEFASTLEGIIDERIKAYHRV